MRILRIADVTGQSAGGMNLFMRRSSDVLRRWGHDVEHAFEEDLGAPRIHGGLRRIAVHWLVIREVLRRRRRGDEFDVLEIHEPIAFGYCLFRRFARGGSLPPCVVISYGSEERRWREGLVRDGIRGTRRSRKSRILVPLTLVRPARYALRHADHVLVPSAPDLSYLTDELRVPERRLTRVDSGVDDEWFEIDDRAASDHLRVLFIGTWIDRKGAPELAEAWSRVTHHVPNVRLTLTCTVVPEAKVLDDFGSVAGTVTAHSFAEPDELRRDIAEHDVFVLPSWFEGGIALGSLQAAAAGLASVVTAIGGNTDLFRVEDPEADGAILVPPNDPGALADALRRLARDSELVHRLGDSA
ncbi:MAG TPA: glycosyltransferase family 4 protein, partial [Gaiellaceae bacterium]|nr:glycosyltransferase family 4 protein [Gaiellaceae bacterium]